MPSASVRRRIWLSACCAEPPGVGALGLRPGMVADDGVVKGALVHGRAKEGSPPVAGGVETPLHLPEHLVHPPVVEPGGVVELGSHFRDHRVGPRARLAAMRRVAQLVPERGLDRQRRRPPFTARRIEVEDRRQRPPEVRSRRLHPHRVDVGADEVAVPEVDARGLDRPRDHPGRLAVEVLVVGASSRAIGEDERGLPSAPGATASLRVVGRGGRHVPQVDEVELRDVDAELHGG